MNFDVLRQERADLLREAESRVLTGEERARLRALSVLLGESIPEEETLAEMAKRVLAADQDDVDTPRPRVAPPGNVKMTNDPPRAPSSTAVEVFAERVLLVLNRLEDLGFGPRGTLSGTIGARGRLLHGEASQLKMIFDGFSAARRMGFRSVTMSADERLSLYKRVGELERHRDEFLAELRSGGE